jgi:glycosyltransferase involved in cell wall biosynthesis
MRVIHVITRLIVGGAQENTVTSVLGLRQKPGLEVFLISGPTGGPEGSLESLFSGCPSALRILPELVRPIHPWHDVLALNRLTAMFRAEAPDMVHTHSGKAGVIGRLAAARAGVPLIIHTIHGPSFGSFQGTAANVLFRAAERRAARVTTHFVVVADAMKEQYLQAGIGRPDQHPRDMSGFTLEPFLSATNNLHLRAKLGFSAEDIIVGKVARLYKLKGHDDLFAVAPELVQGCPQMKFLLVGDGPWRQQFEAAVRALGLEKHFVFTGLVQPTEVASLMGIMDCLVHLSSREGLPRALPQALATGKPVVAYDCDGAKEVCFNNDTGFLVAPGDLRSLKDHLLRLATDDSLRARLGERGRQFVRERFSAQQMVDELYQLYLRLGAAPRTRAD